MPFLFIIVGIVLTIAAVRGTNTQLVGLLKGDFTGKGNFIYWTLAILVIGALGYSKSLQPLSRAFMALVIIVLFLDNKGVFAQFNSAISQTQQTSTSIASGMGNGASIGTSSGNTTGAPFSIPILHGLD